MKNFKAKIAAVLTTVMLVSSIPSVAFAQDIVISAPLFPSPEITETAPPSTGVHSHTFGSWKVTKKATAKEAGSRERICSDCGQKQTAAIPAVKSVKLDSASYVYTGKAIIAKVTVTDKQGIVLKKGRDYTVTRKNNKNVGTATVTVKLTGNYSGKITKTFKIVPAKREIAKLTAGSTQITASWKSNSAGISGYYIRCSTDKTFSKNVKIVKVSNASAAKGVISGLKPKTTYYVKFRAFKKVGNDKIFSQWSKVKSIKTKAKTVETGPHEIAGSVPKSERVSPHYFDDVVFIGDSISLGLTYYEASNDVLGKAQFLTAGSLSATNALWPVSDKSVHPRYNGTKMKLEQSVPLTGAKKVYIMLGMNDINNVGIDKAFANFKTLCSNIHKAAPKTVFYIESVTPRANLGSMNPTSGLTNANITRYNKMLARYANEQGWYFINVASVMFDSNGYLKREYCSDPSSMGMHFASKGCAAWVDYLYTHTA